MDPIADSCQGSHGDICQSRNDDAPSRVGRIGRISKNLPPEVGWFSSTRGCPASPVLSARRGGGGGGNDIIGAAQYEYKAAARCSSALG